jgi:hypothetical protein
VAIPPPTPLSPLTPLTVSPSPAHSLCLSHHLSHCVSLSISLKAKAHWATARCALCLPPLAALAAEHLAASQGALFPYALRLACGAFMQDAGTAVAADSFHALLTRGAMLPTSRRALAP